MLTSIDYMDDGSPIRLRVDIDVNDGSATFDFGGSGPQVWGNTNAPRAVTFSALIYSLRCMIGHDIPLNQGCLNPVKVIIPEGSILDPSEFLTSWNSDSMAFNSRSTLSSSING